MKTLKITNDLHLKLKKEALRRNMTLMQLVIEIITKYFATLCLTVLLVSCASQKMYTKIDETNYERFEHKQKIELGLSMQQVLKMFGTPSDYKKGWRDGEDTVEFIYYNNIACSSVYCFVEFNLDDKEVVHFVNFRMEYINLITKN